MHYIMDVRSLKNLVQKHDVFAVFVANIIHDFEHPGYSNQFIVRTKHPIAIRYSDNCVLENHHLAAAFQLILKKDQCNIMKNIPYSVYREVRKLIIEIQKGKTFIRGNVLELTGSLGIHIIPF